MKSSHSGPEPEGLQPPGEERPARTYAPDGVDLTVIRWMLRLTPTERLAVLQDLVDTRALVDSTDGT